MLSERFRQSPTDLWTVWGKALRPLSGLGKPSDLGAVSAKTHRPLDGLGESPRSRSETGQSPELLGGLGQPPLVLGAELGKALEPLGVLESPPTLGGTRQNPPTSWRFEAKSSNLWAVWAGEGWGRGHFSTVKSPEDRRPLFYAKPRNSRPGGPNSNRRNKKQWIRRGVNECRK